MASILQSNTGKDNVTDTLSRAFYESLQEFNENLLKLTGALDINALDFDIDCDYIKLRNNMIIDPDKYHQFRMHNNRIFIRLEPKSNELLSESPVWKLWIPKCLRNGIISSSSRT